MNLFQNVSEDDDIDYVPDFETEDFESIDTSVQTEYSVSVFK